VALTGQTKVIRSTAPTVTGPEAELIPSAQFSRPESRDPRSVHCKSGSRKTCLHTPNLSPANGNHPKKA